MTDDVQRKLHETLLTHLPPGAKTPLAADDRLVELGLNSLSSVNLVLDLEDTFDMAFPDEMITDTTFQTVGALEASIRRILAGSDSVEA